MGGYGTEIHAERHDDGGCSRRSTPEGADSSVVNTSEDERHLAPTGDGPTSLRSSTHVAGQKEELPNSRATAHCITHGLGHPARGGVAVGRAFDQSLT